MTAALLLLPSVPAVSTQVQHQTVLDTIQEAMQQVNDDGQMATLECQSLPLAILVILLYVCIKAESLLIPNQLVLTGAYLLTIIVFYIVVTAVYAPILNQGG